jgi:hypothetical protein
VSKTLADIGNQGVDTGGRRKKEEGIKNYGKGIRNKELGAISSAIENALTVLMVGIIDAGRTSN